MSTNTEVSKVEVIQPASVDVKRPEDTTAAKPAASAEPSMNDYAKIRAAQDSGEVKAKPAAATDKPAAAAEVSDDKPATPPTDEELLAQISDDTPVKKGINERMSALANGRKTAEAAAEASKAEAAKAKQEAEATKQELDKFKAEAKSKADAEAATLAAAVQAKDDIKPNRDDFEDPDEYAAAIATHAARQELRKSQEATLEATLKTQKEAEEKAQTEAKAKETAVVKAKVEELHKTFNERLTTSKTEYPDFDAKVTNNDHLIIQNPAFFLIEKSELGPHILYRLANNPEELKELNTLAQTDQAAMALRIGELQAEVKIARKAKPSKAAEPHKPVGQRESPARKTKDEMSMVEYAEVRREEDRNAGRVRH